MNEFPQQMVQRPVQKCYSLPSSGERNVICSFVFFRFVHSHTRLVMFGFFRGRFASNFVDETFGKFDDTYELSEISSWVRFHRGISVFCFFVVRCRPSFFGQTTIALDTRKWGSWTLRRIVTALQLIVIVAGCWRLIIIIGGENVAVARIRAVLGRRIRRGITSLAQTSVRPRMVGPVLLSDGCTDRCIRYIFDVTDALDSTMTFSTTGCHRPWGKLRRRWRITTYAAHVLTLTGQTPGIRWRWRRCFFASWTKTKCPTQWALKIFFHYFNYSLQFLRLNFIFRFAH